MNVDIMLELSLNKNGPSVKKLPSLGRHFVETKFWLSKDNAFYICFHSSEVAYFQYKTVDWMILGTLRSTTRPTRRRGLTFGLKMSADLFML